MYHIGSHEIDISICMNEHEPIKRFLKKHLPFIVHRFKLHGIQRWFIIIFLHPFSIMFIVKTYSVHIGNKFCITKRLVVSHIAIESSSIYEEGLGNKIMQTVMTSSTVHVCFVCWNYTKTILYRGCFQQRKRRRLQ